MLYRGFVLERCTRVDSCVQRESARIGGARLAGRPRPVRRSRYWPSTALCTSTCEYDWDGFTTVSVDSIKQSKHSLTQAARLAFVWDHTFVWFLSKHLTRVWEICVLY